VDLVGGHGPLLGHQEGHQRELPHQLVVVPHGHGRFSAPGARDGRDCSPRCLTGIGARRPARPRHPALAAAAALLVAAALLAGCGGDPATLSGRVLRAIDGDTIVVAGVGTVRYLGVDTPELHHPRKPVERLARRAARFNARLVVGRRVRLVTDRERRDAYGRLLAYVYLGRTMVNATLVRLGLARAYPFRPNTRHAALFARLERRARAAGRGLWGGAEGGPPWGRL
jgi:micrococcal nuclease